MGFFSTKWDKNDSNELWILIFYVYCNVHFLNTYGSQLGIIFMWSHATRKIYLPKGVTHTRKNNKVRSQIKGGGGPFIIRHPSSYDMYTAQGHLKHILPRGAEDTNHLDNLYNNFTWWHSDNDSPTWLCFIQG